MTQLEKENLQARLTMVIDNLDFLSAEQDKLKFGKDANDTDLVTVMGKMQVLAAVNNHVSKQMRKITAEMKKTYQLD